MDVGLRDRTTLKLFGYAFTTWYQILFDLPLFETFWITVVSSCWILLCLVVLGSLLVASRCLIAVQLFLSGPMALVALSCVLSCSHSSLRVSQSSLGWFLWFSADLEVLGGSRHSRSFSVPLSISWAFSW
jgi:hypothetical protein